MSRLLTEVIGFMIFGQRPSYDQGQLRNYSSPYACPKCNWSPPDDYYFVFKGLIYRCDEDIVDNKAIAKPPSEQKAYPVYGPINHEYDGGMDWDEIHYCPHCNIEFEISNGT